MGPRRLTPPAAAREHEVPTRPRRKSKATAAQHAINGQPEVADALVQAHLAVHGLAGGWDLVVAGMDLLAAELAEQREHRR